MSRDFSDDLDLLKRLRLEVEGYLELDLPEMAREQLDTLPPRVASHPIALEAWLTLLMHLREWTEAVEVGLQGCAVALGQPSFFVHTAYCLHELGRTEEAHLLLASGPATLQREPLYHYNMGCYLNVLGREDAARDYLREAFRLDKSLKSFAREDRDLEALWPSL